MPANVPNLISLCVALVGDHGDAATQLTQSSASTIPWWYDTFRPLSFQHLLPAGFACMVMAAFSALGLRLSRTPFEPVLRRSFAWTSAAYAFFVSLWYVWPGWFGTTRMLDPAKSLPLHMCDVALLIAPLAMLTRRRGLRTLTFLWGVGLCSQAFITPILTVGLNDFEYYTFWISHFVIVGSAVYDYFAGGFRPHIKDFQFCVGCGLVWVAAVFLINIAINATLGYEAANYGYVGNITPKQPTIVDKLGPWPLRAVILSIVAISGCGVIYIGSRLFEYLEAREKRQPSRIALGILFALGLVMTIVGVRDAVYSTPVLTTPVP